MLEGILGTLKNEFTKLASMAGAGDLVQKFIADNGGLTGVVEKFKAAGMTDAVQSWISTSLANQSITAEQVKQVIGAQTLEDLSTKFGLDSADVADKIAQVLPKVIDVLTPQGVVPGSEAH